MKTHSLFRLAMVACSLGALLPAATATAQTGSAATAQAPAADLTSGEIRKIDKESGKLTLRHEAIRNLDMPAMTMVFSVKDKSMLEAFKVGDKVRFRAVSEWGKTVVTQLEPAN